LPRRSKISGSIQRVQADVSSRVGSQAFLKRKKLFQSDQRPLRGLLDTFAGSVSPPPAIIDLSLPHPRKLPRSQGTTVAYIGGSWDCFGSGHVEYLQRAKAALHSNGPLILVVGIWSDGVVEDITGEAPFFLLLERALAVIQCRYSDALILNAPREMPATIYDSLGIDIVVHGDDTSLDGVKNIQVMLPQLQTLRSLRESVLGRRKLYELRQQR